jgi:ActR/RegA family two-component response regulator
MGRASIRNCSRILSAFPERRGDSMTPKPDGWTHGSDRRLKRVLIVDEDEQVQHLCGYVVKELGMHAHICREPGEALSALAEIRCDFVAANSDFFAHEGVDLIHHIRTSYPNVQILMFTPFNDTESAVYAIRGGASDYLAKPFSADEFRKKLILWMKGRGPFSHWTCANVGDIPVRRTLSIPSPVESADADNSEYLNAPPTKRAAVFADAIRTLLQILERDIEETALFFYVEETQLRKAFDSILRRCWGSTASFPLAHKKLSETSELKTERKSAPDNGNRRDEDQNPRLPFTE